MSRDNTVCIALLTYNRLDYAKRTLSAVLDNISTSKDIHIHIADDGTGEYYRNILMQLALSCNIVRSVTWSDSKRSGYGANVNAAMPIIHERADYLLMLEDDWELTRTLNLDELVKVLDDSHTIDCIRLGYLSFTQELRGRLEKYDGKIYLAFDPTSPELHVLAGHPRIETRLRQRRIGYWPTGLEPGWTEHRYCEMPESRRGVAWAMDLVHPIGDLFAHIGTERSY